MAFDHAQVISRSKAEYGDTLFSNIGSIGDTAYVDTTREFSIKNVALFKPDHHIILGRYLYYLVNGPSFQAAIKSARTGSAQPFLSLKQLRQQVIDYHDCLHEQQRVVDILSAYDDLIENNTRRIKILEEMAQAIYREWFVEFRFPGHESVRMVDSELGPIPEGWEPKPLSDGIQLSRNVIQPSEMQEEVFALYSFSAFDLGRAPEEEAGTSIQSSKFLLTGPCVLYAKLNPRIPRIWLVNPGSEIRALASSEFLVLSPRKPWGLALLYSLLTSPEFANRAIPRASGTSTSHQRVKASDLLAMNFVHPTSAVCQAFEQSVAPMLTLCDRLRDANHNLRATRDLLLPRLISGEIDVSNLDFEDTEPAA